MMKVQVHRSNELVTEVIVTDESGKELLHLRVTEDKDESHRSLEIAPAATDIDIHILSKTTVDRTRPWTKA